MVNLACDFNNPQEPFFQEPFFQTLSSQIVSLTLVLGLASLILVATVATLPSSALTTSCHTSLNVEAWLGHLGVSINTEQCVQ